MYMYEGTHGNDRNRSICAAPQHFCRPTALSFRTRDLHSLRRLDLIWLLYTDVNTSFSVSHIVYGIRHRNVVYTTAVIPCNPCSSLPSNLKKKKKPQDVPWMLLLFQYLWFVSFENQSLVPHGIFYFSFYVR